MSVKKVTFGPLNGPYLPSVDNAPSTLLVFLHGYGANGFDLFGLAQPLVEALGAKDLAIWCPDAPDRLAPLGEGGAAPVEARQWFPIRTLERSELVAGVSQAGPIVKTALYAALNTLAIAPKRLVVVGFSQGGMVALKACLEMDPPIGHIIGLSTAYVVETQNDVTSPPSLAKPAVTLVHGSEDPVVPPMSLKLAKQDLTAAGIECDAHMIDGLQHSIDARAFEIVIGAARQALDLGHYSQ